MKGKKEDKINTNNKPIARVDISKFAVRCKYTAKVCVFFYLCVQHLEIKSEVRGSF
jgi:hypothetical protein